MKIYQYYQPNKKDIKDSYGDCVIRAICKVTSMEWLEVFDGLCEYARKAQCLPNQPSAYEPWLQDHGFEYHSLPCRPRMMTVRQFRKDFKGTAICNVKSGYSSHFSAVSGGQIFDTWDTSDCKIYGYWSCH